MSDKRGFSVNNWLELVAKTTLELIAFLQTNGQIAFDSTLGKFIGRSNSVNDPFVQESRTATLTGKSIDADTNTITNIDNNEIKAGAAIDVSKLADGSVSNTEFQYLDGVTSNIQDQLDGTISEVLPENSILVGNSSDVSEPVDTAASGDILADVNSGLTYKAGSIDNADISATADIDRSKLLAGTADYVLINDGAGDMSEEQRLALVRGGSAIDNSQTNDATTTGSGAQLNAVTGHVRLSNGSLISLAMIPAASAGGISFTLYNDTGNAVTVLNNSGGTAANRIITGSGSDISLGNGASLLLVYDSNETRWLVVGGTGSGGSWIAYSTESVANGGTVSSTMLAGFQLRSVQGSGGPAILSTTPFGTSIAWNDGTVIRLKGASNTDTITILNSDIAYGALLNGDCTLALNDQIELQYDLTQNRWVEANRSN